MIRRIHSRPFFALLVWFCVAGCRERREPSWYEDTSMMTGQRDQYVEDQVHYGIDAKDARARLHDPDSE
jgi:hypothetical protein